jgi:stage IV sporulation protein A
MRLESGIDFRVRLIDCVGYMVEGAAGHTEDGRSRMVHTPWSDKEMPFEKAAEFGTKKVITEHSTIGILVTTDGSITDIGRANYVSAEERVAAELRAMRKPFVIILNVKDTADDRTKALAESLKEKYGAPVLPMNVTAMGKDDIHTVLDNILMQFPLKQIDIGMPRWIQTLEASHPIVCEITDGIAAVIDSVSKMSDNGKLLEALKELTSFKGTDNVVIDMGRGRVSCEVVPEPSLFYNALSEIAGEDVTDEYNMMSLISRLKHADKEYSKIREALMSVSESGYGVVMPSIEEMALEEPQIVSKGNKFGVKLKASAPSLHIIRVDVEAEVSPLVGNEQQSNDMKDYLLEEFKTNKPGLWDTSFFGKSMGAMVKESLNGKLNALPGNAVTSMRDALSKIINKGNGGVICILI